MKYRILKIIGGAAAAVLLFASSFMFAEMHFVRTATTFTPTAAPPSAAITESAEPSSVVAFASASETYRVVAEGDEIVVYNTDGSVALTMPLPGDLPPDDCAVLSSGVTIFGREALLVYLENFEE